MDDRELRALFNLLEGGINRQAEIMESLRRDNPNIGISAFVIAGDILSAEKCTQEVLSGKEALKLVWRVGSYARFDWAYHHLEHKDLLELLPELWSFSDPDDTKDEYLRLWEEKRRLSQKIVIDDKPLPNNKAFKVYRGQSQAAKIGISWSLDETVAQNFGRSGGLRETIKDGIIYQAQVNRNDIIAFLSSRGESEIIVNPNNLY